MESGEKMLNDLKQIKLSGAAFDDQMILDFFKEKNDNKHINGVLLYGRNGSGKSTIAKAFRKLEKIFQQLMLMLKMELEVQLTLIRKIRNIFLFSMKTMSIKK